MKRYSFRVDTELRLLSCSGTTGSHADCLAASRGAHYYECIPRLWDGQEDAVHRAMEIRTHLTLKGYRMFCFYGEIQAADIEIEPLIDESSRCVGADVDIHALPGCAALGEIEHVHPLIDIGKVSVTLAHGVRNPLNAIKGAMVYLNEKYRSDATFGEFAAIINEEIGRLDRFITEFLSTSCLETHREQVQLNDLISKIVKLASFQAQASGVVFATEFGELPTLYIDSFNMGHAILNVINNSIGAMPRGGSVTLRTAVSAPSDAASVSIEISDTGTGMAPGGVVAPDGFPKWSSRKKGRGFGLFITREIIRHHGGSIEISGNREGGTTVLIVLPVSGCGECGDAN
ncbi:sensor histidine kinase [Geobacter pickeringii]|uniref:histidine kinase n=1 Tax=Geobacter pickeringii TaxID=345632 RepID=A0A0B5BHH9_9BACT|nr:ATP-binding protein [Geobacter pickeringii]AJE03491.1 histidine kinase [Geobacter pickeringii]